MKWFFVLSIILLSVYHYVVESNKLNRLSKYINDPKVLSDLKASARKRMGHFLILFIAFLVWIMSYDIEIKNVSKEKDELAKALEQASKSYGDTGASQKRLVQAKTADQNVIDDIKSYYTDIFVNFYVMRKCEKVQPDDIFIINSALIREISLNNISISLRDDIIKTSKKVYITKFSDFQCDQLHGKYSDIVTNYQNYISAVREVLRATF